MLFNTLMYALFVPVVFVVYWYVLGKSSKAQNIFLLLCSYYFYSCWDVRFLGLLLFSTALDYVSALQMQNSKHYKFSATAHNYTRLHCVLTKKTISKNKITIP